MQNNSTSYVIQALILLEMKGFRMISYATRIYIRNYN